MTKNSDREPFFIFYRSGTPKDDDAISLYKDYENVSESMFTELRFIDTELSLPFLNEQAKSAVFVIKDGKHEEFDPSQGLLSICFC
jgi:hypothetical protein